MSVLIRGMKMPKNRYDCPFIRASYAGDYYCAMGNSTEDDLKKICGQKMADCPLVEIPTPHGRLIDADAVNKAMDERIEKLKDDKSIYEASCVSTALDMFAPTVIEAEGSEVTE